MCKSNAIHSTNAEPIKAISLYEVQRELIDGISSNKLWTTPMLDNSMHPVIPLNAIAIVEEKARSFSGDGVYLINWKGQFCIRHIKHETNTVAITCYNSAYKSLHISPEIFLNDLAISGRVIGVYQNV